MFTTWKEIVVVTLMVMKFMRSCDTNLIENNTNEYRLPDDVIPKDYYIHLVPFIQLDNFTFDGKVSIVADVRRDTKNIVIHIDELEIRKITVSKIDDVVTNVDVYNSTEVKNYQFLNVTLKTGIGAGTRIRIDVDYTGKLSTDSYGFFRNWYKVDNVTRWIVATQMEPTGARRVFPCFDEPALKAVFYVSVKVPDNYTAISNTKLKSISNDNIYEFEDTPLMSTYLLALAVTDFQSLSVNNTKREYKVWASSELAYQLPYSLSVMQESTEIFENRFSIPYPVPKLEMIAVPDFPSVAMENWGLLIYSELYMLYDENLTPVSLKKYIRNLITHEIAHQWFGNLVSPLWWDQLWLNEGFAEYFENHAYDDELSSWNLGSQYVVNEMHLALVVDSLESTHAVVSKVYSPSEIMSIFDSITYSKGAALVRMIEKLLGSDMFYGALRRYLNQNQYSTGTSKLLFNAIEEEIKSSNYEFNTTVSNFMDSWTLLSGYPVVNVEFNGDTVRLTQQRFFLNSPKNTTDDSLWWIPLSWATSSDPKFDDTRKVFWLSSNETTITITNASTDWVIFNLQQTGFYRVNYDKMMWVRIINVLKSNDREIIHELNRASLIDDLFNLGRAGLVDYSNVLSATEYLLNETNYIPWRAAFSGFSYLKKRFTGHNEIYELFGNYVLTLLDPHYQRLGFNHNPKDNHLDIIFREFILKWLCHFEHKECVEKSLDEFKKLESNHSYTISPDQKSFLYCVAVKYGSNERWNFLWKKYEESNTAIEKLLILSGFGCSVNRENLERLLHSIMTVDDGIRKQDIKELMKNVIESSQIGLETTLSFIGDNFNKFMEYFADDSLFLYVISSISEVLSTDELVEKFTNVIEINIKNASNANTEYLWDTVNKTAVELEWYKNNSPGILKWLKKYDVKSDNYLVCSTPECVIY